MAFSTDADSKGPLEPPLTNSAAGVLVPQSPDKCTLETPQQGTFPPTHADETHGLAPETKNISAAQPLSGPHLLDAAAAALPGATITPPSAAKVCVPGPSVINKQLLSKLNRSLKEKQKTTSNREPQLKSPTMIQSVLSTSPPYNTGANGSGNVTASVGDHGPVLGPASIDEHAKADAVDADLLSMTSAVQNQGKDATAGKSHAKSKSKKLAKQNSTRTDFFAAKLASAVDDVESSDSDETFVYDTNANEFGNDTSDVPVATACTNITPAAANQKEQRPESINNASAAILLVNDNISVSGSVKNGAFETGLNSPLVEQKRDEDKDSSSYLPSLLASKAVLVHSLQSSKPTVRTSFHAVPSPPPSAQPVNTTGTASIVTNINSGRSHPAFQLQTALESTVQNNMQSFSDPYIDTNHLRYLRHPVRKSSSHSVLSDERKDPLLRLSHNGMLDPVSYGLSEHSVSLNRPYQEGLYSYGEEDCSGNDEASSHGDLNLICTENNAHGVHAPNATRIANENIVVGSKTRSDKPSTTSSKLRSTTSKLFDKKGAQPRRYSTIPDDIDIEDFDDELIYYDNNNIRFPYNNHSNTNTNANTSANQGSLNENTALLNGHKLPHHRSLNLNFNGKRAAAHPRNTRYVSLRYAPPNAYPSGSKRGDIFPFPYPENHHHSFYGFDEYDEDSPHHVIGRAPVSPGHTRYMLLKKVSQEHIGSEKVRIIKSVLYTLVGIIAILAVGFILGFLLASTKDLTDVAILSINHATVSQDELVFNVVVEAVNPGWFTVSMEDLELDIFAKSGYLGESHTGASVETVLLGSVLNFESVLFFEGSFLNREAKQQTGEIKLLAPGKNTTGLGLPDNAPGSITMHTPDNNNGNNNEPSGPNESPDNLEKWAIISKHPFNLILRGVIKYNLPWTSSVKSVAVNKVGYIDPSLLL